jgi:hypothetical protein
MAWGVDSRKKLSSLCPDLSAVFDVLGRADE